MCVVGSFPIALFCLFHLQHVIGGFHFYLIAARLFRVLVYSGKKWALITTFVNLRLIKALIDGGFFLDHLLQLVLAWATKSSCSHEWPCHVKNCRRMTHNSWNFLSRLYTSWRNFVINNNTDVTFHVSISLTSDQSSNYWPLFCVWHLTDRLYPTDFQACFYFFRARAQVSQRVREGGGVSWETCWLSLKKPVKALFVLTKARATGMFAFCGLNCIFNDLTTSGLRNKCFVFLLRFFN